MSVTQYALKRIGKSQRIYLSVEKVISGSFYALSPEGVFTFIQSQTKFFNCAEEFVYVLGLNSKIQIVSMFELSHGTVNASLVDPKAVFTRLLLSYSNSCIIVHNHPSGDCTPSNEDLQTTKRIADCGKLLGITLLDHVIIGVNTYTSLKQRALL